MWEPFAKIYIERCFGLAFFRLLQTWPRHTLSLRCLRCCRTWYKPLPIYSDSGKCRRYLCLIHFWWLEYARTNVFSAQRKRALIQFFGANKYARYTENIHSVDSRPSCCLWNYLSHIKDKLLRQVRDLEPWESRPAFNWVLQLVWDSEV